MNGWLIEATVESRMIWMMRVPSEEDFAASWAMLGRFVRELVRQRVKAASDTPCYVQILLRPIPWS